jgi:serine protease Do
LNFLNKKGRYIKMKKSRIAMSVLAIFAFVVLLGFVRQSPAIHSPPLTIPQIVQAVAGTVVEIKTQNLVEGRIRSIMQPGAGSGVIISPNGYIITNNHVIVGSNHDVVDSITVRLRDGTAFEAEVVGRDERTDLAVIRINATDLPVAHFGDSDALIVGELAIAIGNPLGNLGGTVTDGIISALNRDINIDGEVMNLLQTSAAVNPGNSGGGLFNTYGELIGIVNAKPMGHGGHGIEGIGFAIPSNQVQIISTQLIEFGFVVGRVAFGVTTIDISDAFTAILFGVSQQGLYVYQAHPESGLLAGDRIIGVNGIAVRNRAQVRTIYINYNVGDELEITFIRNGETYRTSVTLVQATH